MREGKSLEVLWHSDPEPIVQFNHFQGYEIFGELEEIPVLGDTVQIGGYIFRIESWDYWAGGRVTFYAVYYAPVAFVKF